MSTKRKPVFLRAMTLVILISCVVPGAFPAKSSPRVVHVFVALADNQHEGIVPVTAALANGSDPARNLYRGAAFGIKSYFKASHDWGLLSWSRPKRRDSGAMHFQERDERCFSHRGCL